MHYGDKEQLDRNILTVIVYKHGTPKKNVFDYQVTSIQRCAYFPPYMLKKILKLPNRNFAGHLSGHEAEHYYMVSLTAVDRENFEVMSITDVTDSGNEIDWLH